MHQVDFQALRAHTVSPIILGMADYWEDLRGARPMPLRREIDPLQIPDALPRIWLMECNDLDHLVHRLVGEGVRESWGQQFTGKTVDEIYDAATAKVMHGLAGFIKHNKSVLQGVTNSVAAAGHKRIVERIAAPFGEDDASQVEYILGCSIELEADAAVQLHMDEVGARYDVENAVSYVPFIDN